MTDVDSWMKCHLSALTNFNVDDDIAQPACEKYETEMMKRAAPAVLASRQACLDAHNARKGIDGESPLVSKRKIDV